jgi:hypothetical protein
MAKAPNSRYMDTVGNGTGTKNAATLDGSSTPVILKIKPGATEKFEVQRLIVSMLIGANNPNVGYGNSASPLTNGIEMKVITGAATGSTVWDITDGVPIKNNHDYKNLCHDEIVSTYGTTESDISWRYTFSKDGKPIVLDGGLGDELHVIINDDLTAVGLSLDEHYFRVGMCKL